MILLQCWLKTGYQLFDLQEKKYEAIDIRYLSAAICKPDFLIEFNQYHGKNKASKNTVYTHSNNFINGDISRFFCQF